jgi:hypothetical protein
VEAGTTEFLAARPQSVRISPALRSSVAWSSRVSAAPGRARVVAWLGFDLDPHGDDSGFDGIEAAGPRHGTDR